MPRTTTSESYDRHVIPGAPSALEDELMRLAAASFRDTFQSLSSAQLDFAGASQPSISPQLAGLVQQIQEQTGETARRNLTDAFGTFQTQIAADLASRGALNTSALGERQVQLGTELGRRLADVNEQARTTAAGQLYEGAFRGQQANMQLLGLLSNLRLAQQSPALLQQLMQFRLATARQTGSFTSQTNTPYDPTALLEGFGSAFGALFPKGLAAAAAVA